MALAVFNQFPQLTRFFAQLARAAAHKETAKCAEERSSEGREATCVPISLHFSTSTRLTTKQRSQLKMSIKQIDCYGFETTSEYFKLKKLDTHPVNHPAGEIVRIIKDTN